MTGPGETAMSTTAVFMMEYRRKALDALATGADATRADRAREALKRMDDGSYGYCTRCGMRIFEARLERWPERGHCASCDTE